MALTPANRFKAALAEGRKLVGAWSMSGSPTMVEALGWSGVDFVVLDLEHSPTSIHGVLPLLQAVDATPAMAVTRMASHDRIAIKHALDLGANSLYFPFVETPEAAAAIVEASLYPPHGKRGFSRMNRASRYLAFEDYGPKAHEDAFLIPQLESPEAIARAAAIAAVPGVGALFVGPGDLAVSLGLMGQIGHADVRKLMAEAAASARAAGKACGTVVGDAESAAWAFSVGYQFVSVSNDMAMVAGGMRAHQEKTRGLLGSTR
jgi:2-dehydro-3-deoxyglucarate aldolase/4-hydroxy-2-oxoheptanedioate aldolase